MLDYFNNDGAQTILSPSLIEGIQDTISNDRQCIILNNRRGYATSVFSTSTNDSISCDFCDVPMSYHKSTNKLLCHYCDSTKQPDQILNKNNSTEIILNGYGTEKIHEILQNQFNKYSFVVSKNSNSYEIKQAIESIFKVKVE